MEFTIYSLGNVDFLAQIMNAVAMVCGTGDYMRLVSIGFVIGLIFIGFQSIFLGAQRINLHQMLVCFIVYLCMFGPSCTVLIEDVYKGQVRNVDNVPLGIGVSGMAISNIGHGLTRLIEQGFSDVDRTTEHGFAESLRILNELRVLNTDKDRMWQVIDNELGDWKQGQRSDSQQAMRNYINECLFVDVMLGRVQGATTLASTPWSDSEVWRSLSDAHAVYLPIPGTTADTGIVSCSRAYNLLDERVMRRVSTNTFQDWVADRINGVQSVDNNQPVVESALVAMGLAQDKVQDFMQALAINSVYTDAVSDYYMTYHDQVTAAAVRQAQIQRNSQWASEGTLFLSAARALMAFFEGLLYAITPIMGFLIATSALGMNLVGKYLLLVVWIQLWLPILSITNLYVNIASRTALESALGDVQSLYTINEMWAQTATWVATGGMMAAATPMVALFLITGSTYAFTTLTNRLGGQDHFNERAASPDAVTTGAVLSRAAAYNSNRTAGVIQTGAESEMKHFELGQLWQKTARESESMLQGMNTQLNQAVKEQYMSGKGVQGVDSLSKDVRDSLQSSFAQGNSAQLNSNFSQADTSGQDASSTETYKTETSAGANVGVNRNKPQDYRTGKPVKAAEPEKIDPKNDDRTLAHKIVDNMYPGGVQGGVSTGVRTSFGNEHKQADSSGEKFEGGKSSSVSKSGTNTRTDSKTIDFTKMRSDQLSDFAVANKGTEVGRVAAKMASVMQTYERAKSASTTFGSSTRVSMAAVTQGMSEKDSADLGYYMRINHADKAQMIQQQADRYSRLYGMDSSRGLQAAQLDFLSESSNVQDMAFAARVISGGALPVNNRDVAGMAPGEPTNVAKTVQRNFETVQAQSQRQEGTTERKIAQTNRDVSKYNEQKERALFTDKNKQGINKVGVIGRTAEATARSEAQDQAWRDLNNASRYDFRDKVAHAILHEGAGNALGRILDLGDSPTRKGDYVLGGDKRQTVTGLTAAQEKGVCREFCVWEVFSRAVKLTAFCLTIQYAMSASVRAMRWRGPGEAREDPTHRPHRRRAAPAMPAPP